LPGRTNPSDGQPCVFGAYPAFYIGEADFPYVVFDFTADYTASGPQKFLEGYQGYLQADALAQYEGLYGAGVLHVCCWAHARRKFVAALEGGDQRAGKAVELIGNLYTPSSASCRGCCRPATTPRRDGSVGTGKSNAASSASVKRGLCWMN
jgi:hypothetical protein